MARLTGQQLSAAKRKREQEHRQEQERLRLEEEQRQARLEEIGVSRRELRQLAEVVQNLYAEMDKLSRKVPAGAVTELALGRVNDLIARCKLVLKGDTFVDLIDPFVPAGSNPEHRDAVLVLSELKQGIARRIQELDQEADLLKKQSPQRGVWG